MRVLRGGDAPANVLHRGDEAVAFTRQGHQVTAILGPFPKRPSQLVDLLGKVALLDDAIGSKLVEQLFFIEQTPLVRDEQQQCFQRLRGDRDSLPVPKKKSSLGVENERPKAVA